MWAGLLRHGQIASTRQPMQTLDSKQPCVWFSSIGMVNKRPLQPFCHSKAAITGRIDELGCGSPQKRSPENGHPGGHAHLFSQSLPQLRRHFTAAVPHREHVRELRRAKLHTGLLAGRSASWPSSPGRSSRGWCWAWSEARVRPHLLGCCCYPARGVGVGLPRSRHTWEKPGPQKHRVLASFARGWA